jgi:glyoxylase-like metal-dependent hydrolase (beta-lactamase superfamily II)
MRINKLIVGILETNCYILSEGDKGIIIDPGEEADRILEAVSDLQIDLILLTHNHFDHIRALPLVKEKTSAEVLIHSLDMIDAADGNFEDGDKIPFDGKEILILHTPGHTPGGCSFLLGNNLFSGDTLFPGGWGNTTFAGGSEREIFKSIREKLMKLPDDTVVYPGHGEATTIGKERPLYF